MRLTIRSWTAAAVLAACASTVTGTVGPAPGFAQDGSAQQTLINQDRLAASLPPLSWSNCLADIALQNAQRIADQGFLSHTNGPTLDLACGIGATYAGENIAYMSGGINDPQANSMFMASPPHRANILGAYQYVATAWVVAPNGYGYIAEEFLAATSLVAPVAPPAGWESLGNGLNSGPDVASWGTGRLDVFARDAGNGLIHKWYDGGAWHPWESLGGQLTSDPAAVSWGPGRLDVFARDTRGSLIHRWYDAAGWHPWESLGGSLTSGPDAASWAARRLDIFARGADLTLIHKWYDGTAWHEWESLGGSLTSDPAAVSWSSGRLDIFARGADYALWHRWYDGVSWRGWESLGGNWTSSPDVASWGAGRLDIFIRGLDSALWHKWYDAAGWHLASMGGQELSDPGAVSWGPGRVDVFLQGRDLLLWHVTV